MQPLGLFWGTFFEPKPYCRSGGSRQGALESSIKLNELAGSKYSLLKTRIVGIVSKAELDQLKQPDGSYRISKTLDVENLPFKNQYCLPMPCGTGVALSEDLILTAGHVIKNAADSYRVVQFELKGNQLSSAHVYEVEKCINRQEFNSDDERDPDIYVKNLQAGEWAIIKLKKNLNGVNTRIAVADKGEVEEYKAGKKTYTLGHPYGLPVKKADGEIVKVFENVIKYETETLPGMSGGPVFSQSDKLIGLHIRGNIEIFGKQLIQYGPTNSEIEKMGCFGHFFQNIIPVIEKISKPVLTTDLKQQDEIQELERQRQQLKAFELQLAKKQKELERKEEEMKSISKSSSSSQMSMTKAVSVPSIAFGKEKWEEYFGDVGEEPPLPVNIEAILDSPCPFWSGGFFNRKKIRDTHLLVLIPEKVDNQDFTFDRFMEMIQKPKKGSGVSYKFDYTKFDDDKSLFSKYLNRKVVPSYWILITRDVIPGTVNKYYSEQYDILEKAGRNYHIPLILEAATSILMEYLSTGKGLFGKDVTNCWECDRGKQDFYCSRESFSFNVGFSNSRLNIGNTSDTKATIGLGAVRKL